MLTVLQWDQNTGWPWFTAQLAQHLITQCDVQIELEARGSVNNHFRGSILATDNWLHVKNHLKTALREAV